MTSEINIDDIFTNQYKQCILLNTEVVNCFTKFGQNAILTTEF